MGLNRTNVELKFMIRLTTPQKNVCLNRTNVELK